MGAMHRFQPTVRNRLSQTIVLANFSIQYGKFINNSYNETASAQGTKITAKGEHEWGHCGREHSPTGTEGSFEVHLDESNEKIAEIYWDCPYIGNNKLEKRNVKDGYDISFEDFNFTAGALGDGKINIEED